jgi:hypothetical protein
LLEQEDIILRLMSRLFATMREAMMVKWLRKKHLCSRYGEVTPRTIERAIKDQRLPPPEFPFGNKIPAWREEVLDAHDKQAAIAARLNGKGAAAEPTARDVTPEVSHSENGAV